MKNNKIKKTARSVLKGKWKIAVPCYVIISILSFFELALDKWKDQLMPAPDILALLTSTAPFITLFKKIGGNFLLDLPVSFCTALLTVSILRMFHCWMNGITTGKKDIFLVLNPEF